MESGGSRRHQSLKDQKPDSPNLRDFLRVKADDNARNSLAGLTLSAVLAAEKRPDRTLLDIFRDDSTKDKKSWKSFRDKLRLRRAGAAWTSSVSIPASDLPMQQNSNRMMSRRHSTRFPPLNVHNLDDPTPESTHLELSESATNGGEETRADLNSVPSNRASMLRRNSSRIPERRVSRLNTFENNAAESAEQHHHQLSTEGEEAVRDPEEGEGEMGEAAAEEAGEPEVRMSLMALLAETDRQMGLDGSSYMMDDGDDEEEEEESLGGGGGGGGGEYNNCCVCMVRHKGAAFIPCGHTFCRLCSRELWVQRGNCPLCNNFILEILDIF